MKPWTKFQRVESQQKEYTAEQIRTMAEVFHITPIEVLERIQKIKEETKDEQAWQNSQYFVFVRRVENNPWIHLSIRRLDREPVHDWRDLQRIKNELVGPEHEALELYPAESRVTDTANQYHLWVLENELPIALGWNGGRRVFDAEIADAMGGKQRAL